MLVAFLATFALVAAACGSDAEPAATGDTDAPSDTVDSSGDTPDEPTATTLAQGVTPDTVAAPETGPISGGTLRYAYQADPVSLDVMTSDGNPTLPRDAIFERLYGFGADTYPVPYLAEGHEISADGLTWTITLREGVSFHNGEIMDADDVIASWGRYQAVGARMNEFFMVDSITKSGEMSIDIATNEVHGGVVESLAAASGAFVVMPKSVIDALPQPFEPDLAFDPAVLVGTGPYTYVEHQPERLWIFDRFADYWGGPPGVAPADGYMVSARNAYFDRIEFHVISDPVARVSAVVAGEIDVAAPIPADQAEAVRGEDGISILPSVPGRRAYWKFNTTTAPFDNLDLRLAVRTGINPTELMSPFGPDGSWRVNCTPRITAEHFAWTDYCAEFYPQDIELAKQMVIDSGYDGTPVKLLASEARAEYPMTIPMITYLEEIGIEVEPVLVDGATYSSMRKDPTSGWNIKHAGGQPITSTEYLNAMGYDRTGEKWPGVSDAYYENISAAARVSDRDERSTLITAAYAALMDASVDLWIGDELTVALHSDRVVGLPTDDYEFNWFNAWLSE
ncbi:MAG: peptide/nickel transport system substrate-binding protein [Verrucomicrobiales bacterium]|jgi:peptide/nickel transport system substrate-binding protein